MPTDHRTPDDRRPYGSIESYRSRQPYAVTFTIPRPQWLWRPILKALLSRDWTIYARMLPNDLWFPVLHHVSQPAVLTRAVVIVPADLPDAEASEAVEDL